MSNLHNRFLPRHVPSFQTVCAIAGGHKTKAACSGTLIYLLWSTSALATCPGVIINGQTEGATQSIGSDASCEVQAGGAISTTGADQSAILGENNNVITNAGNITTNGLGASGVDVLDGNTVTNSGNIETTGTLTRAVWVGDNSTIVNEGSVTVEGTFATGLRAGSGNTIHNTGTVTTTGVLAHQIVMGNDNSAVNDGTLSALGVLSAWGILGGNNNVIHNNGTIIGTTERHNGMSLGSGNTVFNTGLMTSSGEGGYGIRMSHDNHVTNSGSIVLTGDGAAGLEAQGTGNTIVSSGEIRSISTNQYDVFGDGTELEIATAIRINQGTVINSGILQGVRAVDFTGTGDDTLTLLPGSVLIGELYLGAGSDTANILTGTGTILTFDSLPEVINTGGLPFVTSGSTVAVIDQTAFSLDAALGSNLTNSIHGQVSDHLGQNYDAGPGVSRNASAPFGIEDGPDLRFWGQVNGSARESGANSTFGESSYSDFGGVVGVDAFALSNGHVGFFGGISQAIVDLSPTGQPKRSLQADTYFAGVYARFEGHNGFTNLSLSVGQSDTSSTRTILNNAAVGGVETARAAYDSTFISPSLAFGKTVTLGRHDLDLTGNLSYTHIMQDGYTETGSTGGATVQDRDISLWQGRLQVAYPIHGAYGVFTPRVGIAARTTGRNAVAGTVLGQSFGFGTGRGSDITAFAGFNASIPLSDNANLIFDTEFHGNGNGKIAFGARVGLGIKF